MYIEFTLPQGAGGMAASIANHEIGKCLQEWSDKYGGIPYRKKNIKYTVRVTFDDDKYYDFFAMTWSPSPAKLSSWVKNYRFIEPMQPLENL